MKKFKRLMVGLDGKSSDITILKHIEKIKDSFDIDKVYFVHIAEDLELPSDSELLYVEHLAPMDENLKKAFIDDIDSVFKSYDNMEYEIIVKDGYPLEQILKLIEIKQIDLLVLGRKPKPGITYFSRQLANQAPCSVIFVSKTGHREYKKILVPLDFSSISKQAIEDAFRYQKDHRGTEIMPVHFYNIPTGYSKSGKSLDEFSAIMKENARQKFKEFSYFKKLKNLPLIMDRKENVPKKIFDYSLRKGADLIMIGSKGRTRIASFFSGSVATKLVELSYHLPILIDKRKDSNMNALEAVKTI